MLSPTTLIRRTTSLFLALLMLAPTALFDAPALAQQQTGTTFTSESNLVLVPVIVTDRSGQHVPGLQQGDFTILDDGKPMKLASFEEVKDIAPAMKHPTEPGMFTNAIDQTQAAHGMTIIVLDQVNTPFLDQAYARAQLLKFLADHISTNEPTALITIGSRGVHVVHDFTTDTKVLVAALKNVSGRVESRTTLSGDTQIGLATNGGISTASLNSDPQVKLETSELDAFYNGTDSGYGAFAVTTAIEITLNGLRHIAEGMEGIPGRKSLIWATAGFPFDFENNGQLSSLRYYTTGATHQSVGGLAGGVGAGGALPPLPESNNTTNDEIFAAVRPYWERTMQALNRANIAIYPVDARGLVAYSSAASNRVRISDVYGTEAQTHSTMNDIADVTGGKAYYNTNDISDAFAKATQDSSQYYMLGYYGEKASKNQWHKLQVKLEKAGLQVRARPGYMSGPIATKKPEDLKNSDIKSALASPLDYTALQMKVYVDPAQPGSGNKKKVPFEIDVNPGSAALDTSNKNRLSLDLLAVARKPTGEDAARVGYKLETNVPEGSVQQVAQQGVNYKGAIELPPGSYNLRFVVRDNVSGKLGSVTAPVTVQ